MTILPSPSYPIDPQRMNERQSPRVTELDCAAFRLHIGTLADLLVDCVQRGACLGFLLPFHRDEAMRFWEPLQAHLQDGACRIFVAHDASGAIVGTVQLWLNTPPAGAHHAEIAKLLVHSGVRRQGYGHALMIAVEAAARGAGRSLLELRTRSGDAAERLYQNLGFQIAGVIPGYSIALDGSLEAMSFMYKHLPPETAPQDRNSP
ncbi:GNAT family N-acetyltransferase [Undibacterium sp.]|jgi:ribosomal protein S18 acetylase RimI-like enzyme|uniref:GNAT family N-acetyltransferase n=1 Tax=Undibacterium sp. TaxID=1914977 RepID=UPI002CFA4109|nr:GNAT family N-acetyltransferase [Undibacterium sp.]HTD05727.1 GNAT family N-acetyltransferase [Undibacterium sp.]